MSSDELADELTCIARTLPDNVSVETCETIDKAAQEIVKMRALFEALRDAVDAWETHNETGDMMQGYWVADARAALGERDDD